MTGLGDMSDGGLTDGRRLRPSAKIRPSVGCQKDGLIAVVTTTSRLAERHGTDAAFGVLWIIEGGGIRAAASHEVPAAYREFLANEHSSPGSTSGVAQTVREKSVLHIPDAASGEAYRSGDPFAVAAVGRSLLI